MLGHFVISIQIFSMESSTQTHLYKPINTTEYLTKYEKARVLGIRAMQIANGAPVQIDIGSEVDPLNIAEEELKQKKTPLIIRRILPDGTYEDVAVNELIVINENLVL